MSRFHSKFRESQVTDETLFYQRRQMLKTLGALGAGSLVTPVYGFWGSDDEEPSAQLRALTYQSSGYQRREALTPESKVISINNFYEFGTGKSDPFSNAQQFQTNPWTLSIAGECEQPLTLDYDDLFNIAPIEERIYKLRCVEAWSMIIPWLGIPLAALLKKAKPTSNAKYVRFETLYDPKQMPGQRSAFSINYPYVEGLRIDEAMHPLTLLGLGLYGKTLPPQNGAPVRLVVPWKYGFKSIKSIVKIEFTQQQPLNTWQQQAPQEYGFYANVNPLVDHPRWSQASERLISNSFLRAQRVETELFNGYADEVASLYQGLDLRVNY